MEQNRQPPNTPRPLGVLGEDRVFSRESINSLVNGARKYSSMNELSVSFVNLFSRICHCVASLSSQLLIFQALFLVGLHSFPLTYLGALR